MNQKTLTKLEFDKIIALLEEEASSFRGRQLCRRLKPMTDIDKINTYQEQTAAAFTRIVRKGRISFGDAAPVEESMKRLEIGGALSITELLRISRLLANTARVNLFTNLSLTVMVVRRAIPDTLPLFVPEAADETVDAQINAIVDTLEKWRTEPRS